MKTIRLTSISLALALGIGLMVGCSSDDNNNNFTLPPIGGYNNSDEVSATNLVAKWSFDGNANEKVNSLTGTETNASYTAGKKGQAWEGSSSESRYAVVDGATSIGALNSFSFAFWINTANTVAPDVPGQGKGAQGIFSLVKPDQFWGALNLFLENPDASKPNRFLVKLLIENKRSGVVWQSQSPVFNVDDALNTWTHIVFTYDSATSRMSAYQDGILGASLSGPYSPETGYPGTYTVYGNDPGDAGNMNGAPLWGSLDFGGSYNRVLFGSMQFETTPSLTSATGQQDWATSFAGKLDEFRIYKAALTPAEVNAIFELEKVGR
jgi:hypothetical protein